MYVLQSCVHVLCMFSSSAVCNCVCVCVHVYASVCAHVCTYMCVLGLNVASATFLPLVMVAQKLTLETLLRNNKNIHTNSE